jgi:cyclophilin family peptidyl-prolyl cis-trans isomerase
MQNWLTQIWNQLGKPKSAHRGKQRASLRSRPNLELLEDRLTPSASVSASGTLTGEVFLGGDKSFSLPGVTVDLTGTAISGRAINVSTTTGANGAFSFTQVLPGTYKLSRVAPSGFVNGSVTSISNISVAQGQTISGLNLEVAGLPQSDVSLAFFLGSFIANHQSSRLSLPTPGSGSGLGFTLETAKALTNQTLTHSTTSFLDLAGNFIDPDTTNGTVVTFNTSQGSFDVKLFDKDAPQTVTNFLDNIQAGDYTSDVFSRLSNLSQVSPVNPPPTPFQVLQGGGISATADQANNVTGFTTLTTFQPIANESNDALHPNAIGTLAMARTSSPNSATSQFFFNLTDNSQSLANSAGNGFTVFGAVANSTGTTALNNFKTNYTPHDETTATSQSSFFALPLINGFTPASNFPTGATTSDLALTNSVAVTKAPTGHLTYSILSNSNPSVVTATLGSNTAGSNFSANQLKLAGNTAGTSVITIKITDNRGESVTKQFTVTVT